MRAADLYPQVYAQGKNALAHSPQALMLAGASGLGKAGLALDLAHWLLCENNTDRQLEEPCGQCVGCQLFAARQHPDLRWLSLPRTITQMMLWWGQEHLPDTEDKEQIRLESLLALRDFFNLSSTRGGVRVVVINPAEAMNRATANALLKTLEEPPPSLQFILVTNQPVRLLPTIRSRCRQITVTAPPLRAALSFLAQKSSVPPADLSMALALAGGAPVAALRWMNYLDWLGDWQSAMAESRGINVLNWVDQLAQPLRKVTTTANTGAKKTRSTRNAKSAKKEPKAITVDRQDEEQDTPTHSEINLDEALDVLARLVTNHAYAAMNLPPPFSSQTDGASPPFMVAKAQLPKLFALLDEIVYFRRHLVWSLNPQQVLERLLLQWMALARKS